MKKYYTALILFFFSRNWVVECFALCWGFYDAHITREMPLDAPCFINNLWRLSEVVFIIFVLYSDLATCLAWLPAEWVKVMITIIEAPLQGREKQNTGKAISWKCCTFRHKHTEMQTSDKIYLAASLHLQILLALLKGFPRPVPAIQSLYFWR